MARARAFFAAHGIQRITRVVTGNGSCHRSGAFLRAMNNLGVSTHQRIRPFTPRHNGGVERYHRILAGEFLNACVWTSETHRAQAVGIWLTHYNYHRALIAAGTNPQPVASTPASPTS
ncbi:hypothetical protein Kisp01_33420 [Kineosporia sp. NBRC 101677]|nr:hypothetical protein Kisp01_33420 [Kineosporia sp. NBRC 101677]